MTKGQRTVATKSVIAVSVALVMTGCGSHLADVSSFFDSWEQPLDPVMVYLLFGTNDDDAVAIVVAADCEGKYSAMVTYNGEQRQDPIPWGGEQVEVEELDQKFVEAEESKQKLVLRDVDLTVLLEYIRRVVQGVDDEFRPVFITYYPDANLGAALKGLAEELGAKACPTCGHVLGPVVIRELPFLDEC